MLHFLHAVIIIVMFMQVKYHVTQQALQLEQLEIEKLQRRWVHRIAFCRVSWSYLCTPFLLNLDIVKFHFYRITDLIQLQN